MRRHAELRAAALTPRRHRVQRLRCPGRRRRRPLASASASLTRQPAAPGVASSFNGHAALDLRAAAARGSEAGRQHTCARQRCGRQLGSAARPSRSNSARQADAGRALAGPGAAMPSQRSAPRASTLRRASSISTAADPRAASCTRQGAQACRERYSPSVSAASRRCGDRRVPAARAGVASAAARGTLAWRSKGPMCSAVAHCPAAAPSVPGRASPATSRPPARASEQHADQESSSFLITSPPPR